MKRSSPVILLLLIAILGIVPLSASAATSANYVTLKLGAYFPQANDMESFKSGFNGELAFGRYFTPNVAGELGVGYFKSDTDTVSGIDPFLGPISADLELTVIPVTLNVKYIFPVQNLELYGLAGIGAYFCKLEVNGTALGLTLSDSENDTAFGFNLGLGVNYNITPNLYIGAEGKYFWAKPSFFGIDGNIDGIQATANIGYRY